MSKVNFWVNAAEDGEGTTSFLMPSVRTAPSLVYLRIHTELKMNEVFECLGAIQVGDRRMSSSQWSVMILLSGFPVKRSNAEESFYIPFILLPGEEKVVVSWNETLLAKNPESAAKLRIGDKPCLLVMENFVPPNTNFPETKGWLAGKEQVLHVKEDEKNQFEETLLEVPYECMHVAQIIIYGHVNSQSWLLSGEVVDTGGQHIGESGRVHGAFRYPYQATVFDKERYGLPIPAMPVYTFTFVDIMKPSAEQPTKEGQIGLFYGPAKLRLTLRPKDMPAAPVLRVFALYPS